METLDGMNISGRVGTSIVNLLLRKILKKRLGVKVDVHLEKLNVVQTDDKSKLYLAGSVVMDTNDLDYLVTMLTDE